MRRSAYFGVALIGLLVVAAISVAAGSGRKPAKEGQVGVSLRRLSTDEVMSIIRKFPEMVPADLASKRNDTAYLNDYFEFSEVRAAQLEKVFPATRFYKGREFNSLPPFPYLMAVAGNKRYWMPGHFNQLLLDNGLQVTDKNIIELAKTFVLLAAGSEPVYGDAEFGGASGDELASFPQVTFVEARRIEEYNAQSTFTWDVEIRCRIDGEVQTWKLSQSRRFPRESRPVRVGQFARALLLVDGKPGRLYRLVQAPEETRTGRLDPVPRIEIDVTAGNATAEFDGNYYHYYLESFRDGAPTNYWVRLRLYEFDSCEANVYVRVKPQDPCTFGPDTLMGPVAIDEDGEGFIDWAPSAGTQTGMTDVCAGKMQPGDTTFSRLTPDPEQLTIEQVFSGQFQGGGGFLAVHFCDQFFAYHESLEAHAPVFAQRVKNAMLESWQTQVNTWNLGTPPDSDNVHQVFINDAMNWYHALPRAAAYPDSNRRISVPFKLWYMFPNYTTEDSVIRSAVAHEFYHGIQWGLSSGKWKLSRWRWFTEGQARFIQSVQYPVEEFKDTLGRTAGLRLYPTYANRFLTRYLNTSLRTLSEVDSIAGYPYCLFWRYMYENFGRDSGGVQLVKDCYAVNVGTSNSIGRGKAAIDSAIRTYVPGGIPTPGWSNFGQVLDQFAVACYLNDPSFNKWNPDPPGIYSPPDLTLDTAFRLGPDETDSYIKDDGIPHSFGIDLMQVALNGRVPVPESEIGVHHKGTKTQRGYEAQMVLSAWRSWRLGGSISDPGPADGLDKQSAGSRLAGLTERV